YATNWELSTLRALSVVYFLQEKGMPADKLIAAGFGEHQPIGDNSTDAGKKVNRRIELIVLPTVDEIPSFPERL
ncbi:MAG: OmpA family protein, partial [Myxococcota bacterium]